MLALAAANALWGKNAWGLQGTDLGFFSAWNLASGCNPPGRVNVFSFGVCFRNRVRLQACGETFTWTIGFSLFS